MKFKMKDDDSLVRAIQERLFTATASEPPGTWPQCICADMTCWLNAGREVAPSISCPTHGRKVLLVTPLSDAEIKDLLGSTLHGPLPQATQSRVFATLSEVPDLRKAVKAATQPTRNTDEVRRRIKEALNASDSAMEIASLTLAIEALCDLLEGEWRPRSR